MLIGSFTFDDSGRLCISFTDLMTGATLPIDGQDDTTFLFHVYSQDREVGTVWERVDKDGQHHFELRVDDQTLKAYIANTLAKTKYDPNQFDLI